ncbi:MAG: YbaB/EbfC family nucleoid-associated protein [Planctomycetes bacterium]|nr:YbaB/EbfC family nucleoid-associated protein [Planctomycetota bacterium]
MFKGLGNIASLMRQAQQMGGKLQELNERLKNERATASTGAGLVEVEVNGLGEVLRVKIDPSLVERGDREMIEDLVPAAVNQAVANAKQLHADAMRSMTEGLNVPGLDEAISQITGGGDSDEGK